MADLDDFFAKKDRKKTKGKKFATPDELVKKLEDTTKKNEVKPRKEPQSLLQSTQSDGVEIESGEQSHAAATEEDEWKEFEEEERKDYTGLKIQNLQLNDDDYYSGSDGDGGDGDGDGDDKEGAWKKLSGDKGGSAESKSKSNADSEASAKKSGLAASSTGRYVSPALRQQQSSLLAPVRLKKDALPDINNQEYFPTLGDAKKEELRKKKNEPAFEEVRQGARYQRSSDLPTNAPVSIGNRYNSLADS